MISGDKAPAAAEAGGAETGADAVDGAGATAAEVAAAGAAAGTTSSVGADLGLPSRQERSSPLRGATKVAPYGFSQRDRSYAFAFFDASMRTSTSTAITMSTTPSASEIQGFFVKPAMM